MLIFGIYCLLSYVFIQQIAADPSFNFSNFNFSVNELYEFSGEASGEYNVSQLGNYVTKAVPQLRQNHCYNDEAAIIVNIDNTEL